MKLIVTLALSLLSWSTALVVKPAMPLALQSNLRLRGGGDSTCCDSITTEGMNIVGALYYGLYGIGQYTYPKESFGEDGLVPYHEDTEGPVGTFYARAFGAILLSISALGFFEPKAKVLTKVYGVGLTLFAPLLGYNVHKPEGFKKNMMIGQLVFHLPFTALMLWKGFVNDKCESDKEDTKKTTKDETAGGGDDLASVIEQAGAVLKNKLNPTAH